MQYFPLSLFPAGILYDFQLGQGLNLTLRAFGKNSPHGHGFFDTPCAVSDYTASCIKST